MHSTKLFEGLNCRQSALLKVPACLTGFLLQSEGWAGFYTSMSAPNCLAFIALQVYRPARSHKDPLPSKARMFHVLDAKKIPGNASLRWFCRPPGVDGSMRFHTEKKLCTVGGKPN